MRREAAAAAVKVNEIELSGGGCAGNVDIANTKTIIERGSIWCKDMYNAYFHVGGLLISFYIYKIIFSEQAH